MSACGGCGEKDERRRCLGCIHDFGTPESEWMRRRTPAACPIPGCDQDEGHDGIHEPIHLVLLREHFAAARAEREADGKPHRIHDRNLMHQAADEIERLQTALFIAEGNAADRPLLLGDIAALREEARRLEDAAEYLWGLLPPDQVRWVREDVPTLYEFLGHLHHKIGHEEAMTRRNVFAEEAGR